MEDLSQDESAIVHVVRDFVDAEVKPVVRELEHANTYPEQLIEAMKQLRVFGLAVPEPWGETRVSTPCYTLVTEELARGWMSLAGARGATPSSPSCSCCTGPRSRRPATCPGWRPASSGPPWP